MATEVSEMLDRARESMSKALTALDLACDKVIAELAEADEYNEKLGSHLAWVTAKVAEITSALRQLEKHDKAMAKSPAQRHALVMQYIRDLDAPRRAEIVALCSELEKGRVLS